MRVLALFPRGGLLVLSTFSRDDVREDERVH